MAWEDPGRPQGAPVPHWTPMQERLGENLTEFIRHFVTRNGGVTKQGEVYFALKEKADQKTQEDIVA